MVDSVHAHPYKMPIPCPSIPSHQRSMGNETNTTPCGTKRASPSVIVCSRAIGAALWRLCPRNPAHGDRKSSGSRSPRSDDSVKPNGQCRRSTCRMTSGALPSATFRASTGRIIDYECKQVCIRFMKRQETQRQGNPECQTLSLLRLQAYRGTIS